ncbi:MAG: MBL fold metallo-hydrolase [Candidatus Brocadiae bacterium]|nr:MBL fold metallo-hydrolase [Candidatus Brocadiia bacterium]
MRMERIVVGPFQQNARVLVCEKTNEAILIDPGDEAELIEKKIQAMGVKIQYILATHAHIDHIGGVAVLQKKFTWPFYMHKGDEELAKSLPFQAAKYEIEGVEVPRIDKYIEDGEALFFGECRGIVIHTPGHSPGGVSFLFGEDVFVGDVLFSNSIGRTDLPGGSFAILQKSIKERLYTLPGNTRVHPGHGYSTTIEYEKAHNPFVRG